DPSTTWSTETYYEGNLKKTGGTGSGIYLDAKPRVAARAMQIQTPTPGFAVQVYTSDHIDLSQPFGSSASLAARGWKGPIAASSSVQSGQKLSLHPPGAPRFYLMWMTTLPPSRQSATIADITLYK